MHALWVWDELHKFNLEMAAMEAALSNAISVACNAGRPVIDEPWMPVLVDNFWPIKSRARDVQRRCLEYARLAKTLDADKRVRHAAWAATRATATAALDTNNVDDAGPHGRTVGVHVVADTDAGADANADADAGSRAGVVAEEKDVTTKNDADKKDSKPGFVRFAMLPTELRLMIWEAATMPPPCGHVMDITKPPKTDYDVAMALDMFPDAGLWRACSQSRKVMRRAYRKQAAYFNESDEWGEHPYCAGDRQNAASTLAERDEEKVYDRFARMARLVRTVEKAVEFLISDVEQFMVSTKQAVHETRRIVQPLVDKDTFAEAFDQSLRPQSLHQYIPLWRLLRIRQDMCRDRWTFDSQNFHDYDEQYGSTVVEQEAKQVEKEDEKDVEDAVNDTVDDTTKRNLFDPGKVFTIRIKRKTGPQ
ncbi:hypothetical protein SPBR_01766 [Sporothrix brasiliensis 5110]|uniref:2EXR domain-containing protein n=1 Tax=Sporothrix brasiliensis 5110 TaxID=1398154 RepID=A0A0C2IQM4_9PEZI|nr:uncharacterized protein SPBR_01766 [Sporothrix brasiliensis 5110]KIH91336.1 hypothetical protein SPBR_01766 [Sporothrix brasiliensis 5110]